MKVYIVGEYPHGYEDDIHSIKLVTADKAKAEKAAQPDYVYFVEEHDVDVPEDF